MFVLNHTLQPVGQETQKTRGSKGKMDGQFLLALSSHTFRYRLLQPSIGTLAFV